MFRKYIVIAVTFIAAVAAYGEGNCTVGGVVVDAQGNAIAGADVYLEEGLGGPLQRTQSDSSGRYTFSGIGTGPAGVFAVASGYAFGGDTVTLALGDTINDVQLTLRSPVSLQGTVTDEQRNAVNGALIDRVAIIGDKKYSVPLSRLQSADVGKPVSDGGGRFTVNNLPNSGTYALKVVHPSYAQEAIGGIQPGSHAEVTLYAGVLVRGEVLTRAERRLVPGVTIELRNAQPPHDTSSAVTTREGGFEMRVKPGIYAYRAIGSEYRSPAWQRLTLQGDNPSQWIRLVVSKLGRVRGEVRDAASGDPLPGVRMSVIAGGELAGVIRTGSLGAFDVEVASGLVDVKFEAPDGYRAPDNRAMRLTVDEDTTLDLPTIWMAPIAPAHAVIENVDGSPSVGSIARLVRPEQQDWIEVTSDGDAHFTLNAIPDSGAILAVAHHTSRNESALFTIDAGGTASQARLVPNGGITGVVTNDRGKKVGGAVITIFYAEEGPGEPTALWQSRSDRNGVFNWPSALARVPLRVVAHVPDEDGIPVPEQSGESSVALVDSGATFDVGNIVIPEAKRSDSAIGDRIRPDKFEVRCGSPVSEGTPTIAVSVPEGDTEVINALERFARIASQRGVAVVAMVNWPAPCSDSSLTIVSHAPPSFAKTYAIDGSGRVVSESMAMPTYATIRGLLAR